MAKAISVTGQKKVMTLQKEFNEQYPYIRINVYSLEEKTKREKGGTISPVDNSQTIATVRTKQNPGNITITGNKKVKTLENEFEEIYGLYVEVAFETAAGKRYYTRSNADNLNGEKMEARVNGDNMTLSALNALCEQDGCKKGVWN
ncbi:MAG: hypothetical protein IKY87_02250 [Paludibacteraceae bacterium]|nr:hypothetical protein [Paludibacteraceae bacterium]